MVSEYPATRAEDRRDRGPDLNLQGVGAGADKGLDAQVLLQRLEEQLDLPPLAVNIGDGGGGEAAMVGEKHQGALLGFVPDFDAAQEQVALAFAGHLVEEDDLVALDASALRDRTALQDAIVGVVLQVG